MGKIRKYSYICLNNFILIFIIHTYYCKDISELRILHLYFFSLAVKILRPNNSTTNITIGNKITYFSFKISLQFFLFLQHIPFTWSMIFNVHLESLLSLYGSYQREVKIGFLKLLELNLDVYILCTI